MVRTSNKSTVPFCVDLLIPLGVPPKTTVTSLCTSDGWTRIHQQQWAGKPLRWGTGAPGDAEGEISWASALCIQHYGRGAQEANARVTRGVHFFGKVQWTTQRLVDFWYQISGFPTISIKTRVVWVASKQHAEQVVGNVCLMMEMTLHISRKEAENVFRCELFLLLSWVGTFFV